MASKGKNKGCSMVVAVISNVMAILHEDGKEFRDLKVEMCRDPRLTCN